MSTHRVLLSSVDNIECRVHQCTVYNSVNSLLSSSSSSSSSRPLPGVCQSLSKLVKTCLFFELNSYVNVRQSSSTCYLLVGFCIKIEKSQLV